MSKKKPLLRTGLPKSSVTALWPDILPAAASNTCSGIPLASSATSITLSEWTPCSASGCSARDVLALMNASVGASLTSILSCFTSSCSCNGAGSCFTHRFSSANSASYNWLLVGAVTTILTGKRSSRYQMMAHDAAVLLPTPCPLLTLMRRLLAAMWLRNSSCQGSGLTPSTSLTNSTGLFLYNLVNAMKGLSLIF